MKELARISPPSPRRPSYNHANFNSSSKFRSVNINGRITKFTVIGCAVLGIVLGGIVFKLEYNNMANTNTESFKEILKKSMPSIQVVYDDSSDRLMSSTFFKSALYGLFGIDTSNPISILNSNFSFFSNFYDKQYIQYVQQKEIDSQSQQVVTLPANNAKNTSEKTSENTSGTPASDGTGSNGTDKEPSVALNTISPTKEVSSSITFEDDVLSSDKANNPVVSTGKIDVINETNRSINIQKLLNDPLKLMADKKGPKIFIYHTHTTESYLKSLSGLLDKSIPSRTSNNAYNVVRVGEELTKNLKKYKIDVLHNTTVHDTDFNSSYVKSLNTLSSNVSKYSSLKVTIDLHRDAMREDEKLRVVKKVNGKNAAQIMFVIGTDVRLNNPNWMDNLKFAVKVQQRLNEICPGLAKPIYISKYRYNQHLTNGSVIIEIGGDGNVIGECLESTKYLAQAINDVMY